MSEHGDVTLFGIPNCEQVKKARAWLAENGIAHVFHDVKKQPLPTQLLRSWCDSAGWERLLNRQGTTWRKLDPARQAAIDAPGPAILLLQEQPSIMKRPVLQLGERIEIGFDPQRYRSILPSSHSRASA